MDFLRILRSLEELLYEVMTWLVFYPRTMWISLRHPIRMLRYSDRELKDAPEQQFTDTLSPPLFLMITILLSHMVEIASHAALPKPGTAIGRQIMASDENLLLLRSILFAIYPLMFAIRRLKRQGVALNRDSLRGPFFAQCYIAGPAAFVLGLAAIMIRSHADAVVLTGGLLALVSIGWYLSVEIAWLRAHSRMSRWAAFWSVGSTYAVATILNAIVSFFVLGTT